MIVNGNEYGAWLSYSVSRDVYAPEDPFSFMATESVQAKEGDRCTIEVNGSPLITGIVDIVRTAYTKRGKTVTVEGRGLLGLAVDEYVTYLKTFQKGSSFQTFAKKMVSLVPILKDQKLIIEAGVKTLKLLEQVKAEPAETVFDVLNRVVQNMGVLFYTDPKGNIVFGYPSTLAPKYALEVKEVNGVLENNSNIMRASASRGSKQFYRNILILTQVDDDDADEEYTTKKSFTDPQAPLNKTIVRYRGDGQRTEDFGNEYIRQQRFRAFRASYSVSGHTSAGILWDVNSQVSVRDSANDVHEPLLIYSASYSLTKRDGQTTSLQLGRKK